MKVGSADFQHASGLSKALALSISASSVSDLTLPGTTNRYQRQWGITLVERLRDALAEVLRAAERSEAAC